MLKSENGRLISWVFIDIEGTSIGEYIAAAKTALDEELVVPPRYSYSFAGQYEYMQRVDAKLKQVIPMALGVIFILLMMTFGSTMQASIIMLSLPFALVGSTWLLYLLDYNISVAVAVGMIALAGVAARRRGGAGGPGLGAAVAHRRTDRDRRGDAGVDTGLAGR